MRAFIDRYRHAYGVDARRHDVEVRPVDVDISGWDASLEPTHSGLPAVRLGVNLVRGLTQEAAWRVEEARLIAPFTSVNDLALRAGLDAQDLTLLASASALASLSGNRREAMWVAYLSLQRLNALFFRGSRTRTLAGSNATRPRD